MHEQTSSAQVIANYEMLAALTAKMREAAELSNWEELINIEKQCDSLIAAMKKIDAETRLDVATHQRKNQLIEKILADEDEIRDHTHDWMKQLQNQISSNHQEQRLHKTYQFLAD